MRPSMEYRMPKKQSVLKYGTLTKDIRKERKVVYKVINGFIGLASVFIAFSLDHLNLCGNKYDRVTMAASPKNCRNNFGV